MEREPVARQRRRDDREGVSGIAAEASGIRQQRDQFVKFPDRAWPPVQEKKWKGGWADAWLMNEVQLDLRQGDHKLLKGVEVPLVDAPVVLGAPVHDEFSQIGKVGAVSPATTGELVRKANAIQPRAEVSERRFWDADSERSKFQDDLPAQRCLVSFV